MTEEEVKDMLYPTMMGHHHFKELLHNRSQSGKADLENTLENETEQQFEEMLRTSHSGENSIENITLEPENVTGDDISNNVRGGIDKNVTEKDEKLCKGVKVRLFAKLFSACR